jgi:hypothetical protein
MSAAHMTAAMYAAEEGSKSDISESATTTEGAQLAVKDGSGHVLSELKVDFYCSISSRVKDLIVRAFRCCRGAVYGKSEDSPFLFLQKYAC